MQNDCNFSKRNIDSCNSWRKMQIFHFCVLSGIMHVGLSFHPIVAAPSVCVCVCVRVRVGVYLFKL